MKIRKETTTKGSSPETKAREMKPQIKVGADEIGFWTDKEGILYLCITASKLEEELNTIHGSSIAKTNELLVDTYRCIYEPSGIIKRKDFQQIGKTNEAIARDYVSKELLTSSLERSERIHDKQMKDSEREIAEKDNELKLAREEIRKLVGENNQLWFKTKDETIFSLIAGMEKNVYIDRKFYNAIKKHDMVIRADLIKEIEDGIEAERNFGYDDYSNGQEDMRNDILKILQKIKEDKK